MVIADEDYPDIRMAIIQVIKANDRMLATKVFAEAGRDSVIVAATERDLQKWESLLNRCDAASGGWISWPVTK